MTLGECILWDDVRECLFWTDINEYALYIMAWNEKIQVQHPTRVSLPKKLASFGLTSRSNDLIAAFSDGLAWLNLEDYTIRPIIDIASHDSRSRLNDGRIDRQGRFWVGSMIEDEFQETFIGAKLYCYDSSNRLTTHKTGLTLSNGIAWSPDGQIFYFTDSKTHTILSHDFDTVTGKIKNPQIFASVNEKTHPDGACIDSQGFLWSAQWGSGEIVRYAPNGFIDYVLPLPTQEPTCICFGGPQLDHLCVVTANLGTPSHPLHSSGNGSVYIYKTSITGLPEQRFHKPF